MPLNADQRGETGPNGKPSFTVDEAAENLLRDGYTWAPVRGTPITLTFSFRTFAPNDMPTDTAGFTPFSEAQKAAARLALQAWSDVANITFREVGDFAGQAPVIRFGNYATGEEGAAAFAYYPGDRGFNDVEGDIWVRAPSASNGNGDLGRGGQGVFTLVHEVGHALGLAHPGDYNADQEVEYGPAATYYEDARGYSVMSYFGSVNTGVVNDIFGAAPQLDDVAAIQKLYGANLGTRAGDTVYGFNSNTGRSWLTLTSAAESLYTSIWDGGGTDTLDVSLYTQNQTIDLREGAFSNLGASVGALSIAIGAVIENAVGGSGGDTITGNAAVNFLQGGAGDDRLLGGVGGDLLGGDAGNDVVLGEDGDDAIGGGSGGDTLEGLAGADRLYGEGDGDTLNGGDGVDLLDGGLGADTMRGGGGNDLMGGGDEGDALNGEADADTLYGDAGDDSLSGGEGADVLDGALGNDRLYGEGGDDLIGAGDGADQLDGGAGVDFLYGEAGDDVIDGGEGADLLDGAAGADTLRGGAGRDVMGAGEGNDILEGGEDDDQMYGERGDDRMVGGAGADFMMGQDDADRLEGGDGSDTLIGGAGADTLIGGEGFDQLAGETGADVFDLGALAGFDVALDFNRAEGDRIGLAGLRFDALSVSDLNGDGVNDSTLTYAGGTFVAIGVGDLDLQGWNALVI